LLQVQKFKSAIEAAYYFEMFVDDRPVRGYIGEVEQEELLPGKAIQRSRVYLYSHLDFVIEVKDNQIVMVNVSTDVLRRIDITDAGSGMELILSYSVKWVSTPAITSRSRLHQYAHDRLLGINWLVLVLSLLALVSLILMKTSTSKKGCFDEVGEVA
jgi:transmembrane 9 superfamily protein 3